MAKKWRRHLQHKGRGVKVNSRIRGYSKRLQDNQDVPVGQRASKSVMDADDWMAEGVWVNVKSSNVSSIQYWWDSKSLFVQFKSGATYVYAPVPPAVAKAMFNAASPGKFVWRRLRDRFPYGRL